MKRTLAIAFTAIAFSAPAVHHAHASILDVCVLNQNGQALLKAGLQSAQYDVTSRAYVAFATLGFNETEFNRSEAEQMVDVATKAAFVLKDYNDGSLLPLAQATGMNQFFYDDTLACLKQAATVAQRDIEKVNTAIADQRVIAKKEAQAKAEADRARLEADAKAKVESERAEIEAEAKAKIRAEIEADLRAKAEAEAKAKADAEAKADTEAASMAKDNALEDAKAANAARLEADAVARHDDQVRAEKAAAQRAVEEKARLEAEAIARHEDQVRAEKAAAQHKVDEEARIEAQTKAAEEDNVRLAKERADASSLAEKAYIAATKAADAKSPDYQLEGTCSHLPDAQRAVKSGGYNGFDIESAKANVRNYQIACDVLKERRGS